MILTYDQYLTHNRLVESRRNLLVNIFNQFEDIKPVINEAIAIVDEGVFDMVFESEDFVNEENLVQKMKAKFDQAVQVAKEKGKQALTDTQTKIVQLGGNIVNIIKLMIDKLKEWMKNLFDAAKGAYMQAMGKEKAKVEELISKMKGETKTKLGIEIQNLKDITSHFVNWIFSGFPKEIASGTGKVVKQDVSEAFELAIYESLNEAVVSGELDFTDLLKEGDEGSIPFLSSIAKGLNKVPPFSLLYKVKSAVAKVGTKVLNRFSFYATEMAGAPGPYEFAAIAVIIGVIAEVQIKGVAKHAILHAVPGLGTVAAWLSNAAMALALIAVVEAVIKANKDNSHA